MITDDTPDLHEHVEARAPDRRPGDAAARGANQHLEALRRELERWRAFTGGDQGLLLTLLHHSPHGIFVCDANGRFILQNRAAERIWAGSATLDSVDGWGVYRAFHPDGRPYEAGDWSMARCLSRREIVEAEEVHFQRFDGTHGILLGSCAPILDPSGKLDGALGVFADITALKQIEERLQLITDSLPVLISYVDVTMRYRFANRCYERWFGLSRAEIESRHPREVLGQAAFELVQPHVDRALRGTPVTFQARMPYLHGGERFIDATLIPHFGPDRSVLGLVELVSDISERHRIERERARWTERTEQLLHITAALTDAVTEAEVLEAVVDRPAEVLHASGGALWLVDDDRRSVTLARSIGRSEGAAPPRGSGSRGDVLAQDPESDGITWASLPGHAGRAQATLPLTVEGRWIGALVLTFEGAVVPSEEDRALLLVVARHCAQALERVRLLREAELAYAETTLLYRLTDAVNRAQSVAEVYETSLDTIRGALGIERASILFFDAGGSLRFEAWRGLSEAYRRALEGQAFWRPDEADPGPVYIEDVREHAPLAEYVPLFSNEDIAALALVPLVYESRHLGKLMLCWDAPRSLPERERSVARSIADQIASAVGRKRAQQEKERLIEQLRETVHLNELFAGVVGHDLRIPLMAIMTGAQLALRRDEGERLRKLLRRILSAGDRMARMIEQLLDFTRVRAIGRIPVDPQEMDLGEVGRCVLDEVADASPDRSIVVDMAGPLHGHWDADRLAQVISNLAGNAVQHGTPGAVVTVAFDGLDDDLVVMRISNAGAIRPELVPVLFEPFRGADLRKERTKGLGLGLYITQQIVLAHGGSIDVSGAAEGLTTFTVTLPRRARSAGAATKGFGAEGAGGDPEPQASGTP